MRNRETLSVSSLDKSNGIKGLSKIRVDNAYLLPII